MQRDLDNAAAEIQAEEAAGGAQGEQDIVVRALGPEHPGRHRGEGLLSSEKNRMVPYAGRGTSMSVGSSSSSTQIDVTMKRMEDMMKAFIQRVDDKEAQNASAWEATNKRVDDLERLIRAQVYIRIIFSNLHILVHNYTYTLLIT